MSFRSSEWDTPYQEQMRLRAERFPAVLDSSDALRELMGIALGTRYVNEEKKVILWDMPRKSATEKHAPTASGEGKGDAELTLPTISISAPEDEQSINHRDGSARQKTLKKRRSSQSLEKPGGAPRRRLHIDTALANANRFRNPDPSEHLAIGDGQLLPPLQQAVYGWISGHDAQTARNFSLMVHQQMEAPVRSVRAPPSTQAPLKLPSFDPDRTTLFPPLIASSRAAVSPPPCFFDQYDLYYNNDRPVNWDPALSEKICHWLSDTSTIACSTDLRYIHLNSTNQSINPVDFDAHPHLPLCLTRFTISSEAALEKPRNDNEAPLLDWMVVECSSRNGDYWLMAFPACAITKTFGPSPALEQKGGSDYFVDWTLGREYRVPLMHGRNVPRGFLAQFFDCCIAGKGLIELGTHGPLFQV